MPTDQGEAGLPATARTRHTGFAMMGSCRMLMGLVISMLLALQTVAGQTISTAPRVSSPVPVTLDTASVPARVGRVALLVGAAQLWDSTDRQWTPLMLNRPVTSGDRIRSDRDARVEVQIGSLGLFLGPHTEVELSQVDDQAVHARLLQGHLVARVRTFEWTRELLLLTEELQAQAVEPGLFRLDRDQIAGGRSAAAALRGGLLLRAADLQWQLAAGQRVESQGRGGAAAWRSTTLLQDAFAGWLTARDQSSDPPTAWSVASPEITGLESLDRHGQWDSHPELGAVWIPSVRPGWEPFQDGRWVWVRPWGWTWVDDAPWGFAPSHYGRWVQWNTRWVWSPGYGRQHRPVFAPAAGHWGGGGQIVWRSATPPPRHHWHPGGAAVPVVPGERLNVNPVVIIDHHRNDRNDHRLSPREGEWRTVRPPIRESGALPTVPPGSAAGMTPSAPPGAPQTVVPITTGTDPAGRFTPDPAGRFTPDPSGRFTPDRRHGAERPDRGERLLGGGSERPPRADRGENPPMPPKRESPSPADRPGPKERSERQRQLAQ